MHALAEGLSIDTERFASPLNCSAHLTKYFSRYDEDGAFGANVDAFSCRWVGASQCNPEYEPGDMNKAVKWAIASAMASDSPSLRAFILPWWEHTAYFQVDESSYGVPSGENTSGAVQVQEARLLEIRWSRVCWQP